MSILKTGNIRIFFFKNYKKISLVFLFLFLVVAIKNFSEPTEDVKVCITEKGRIEKTIEATGKMTSETYFRTSIPFPATISRANIKPGQRVKEGDFLLSITSTEMETYINDELRKYYYKTLDYAEKKDNVTISKELLKMKAITLRDYYRKEEELFNYEKDEWTKISLHYKEISFLKSLLEYKSEYSGVITKVNFKETDILPSNTWMFELIDDSRIMVNAVADKYYADKIKEGHKAKTFFVNNNGEQKVFNGEVNYVNKVIENNCFKFSILMSDVASEYFDADQDMSISIIEKEKNDVIKVPVEAIRYDGTKTYVQTINSSNRIKNKNVSVGIMSDTDIEITKGLASGEKLVIFPYILKNGQKINELKN